MLKQSFFNKDAQQLARDLLGKVLRVKHDSGYWLSAMIIETEAYYLSERGSHASLGFTEKRKALFMPAGTIYMYYARGGDSLNFSAEGDGDAVLIKGAMPYLADQDNEAMLAIMHRLNPQGIHNKQRPTHKLCAGQTLLCRALGLRVPEWDQQQLNSDKFFVEDVAYQPERIVQTTRLGIPAGRDEDLPYRFIDYQHASSATKNPLAMRKLVAGADYVVHT